MKKYCFLLFFLINLCTYAQTDSIHCTITLQAVDLSENMSRVSTKDDELMVLIYESKDSAVLGAPIGYSDFVLTSTQNEKVISCTLPNRPSYLIMIIEQDNDLPVQQIDPVMRVYHQEIIALYTKRDWLALEKYMGDNDLLGCTKFNSGVTQDFDFKNRQNLDAYHYKLKIAY